MTPHGPLTVSLLCALLLVAPLPVRGQGLDVAGTFRLAQTLEQAGEYERAVPLYRELLQSDPSNVVYFEGLERVLLQLKRYDDAATLIRSRLKESPGNIGMLCQLGNVYYKAGEEKEAMAAWDRALSVQPVNAGAYRMVAAVMMENRLLDRTAELYRRARVALGDPDLFCLELAQLLSVSMDYPGASAEYLRWLRRNPAQLAFVESRMGLYTGKAGGREAAMDAVRKAMDESDEVGLKQLLAWLQLEGKDFQGAFDTYRTIDRQTEAHGNTICSFGDQAFKEGAYAIAAQAYREAINVPLPRTKIPYAEYGEACALKELGISSDSTRGPFGGLTPVPESAPGFSGAVSRFRSIIAAYPRSEFSARSYYQIGLIEMRARNDLDAALQAFQQAGREFAGNAVLGYDVALRIATVYVARGDTASAARELRSVAGTPGATPDQSDEANYRLAEIDYFGGKFNDAIARLEGITVNLKADYANDAIQLLAFLHENSSAPAGALAQFARADFLARQQKNTEAIALFRQVVQDFPGSLLIDDALMKIGELQGDAGMYADALATFRRLLTDFKDSGVGLDRAQFRVAEIQQYGLHDPAKAIEAYEQLLANFPDSVLANEARKRIRQLRGDAL